MVKIKKGLLCFLIILALICGITIPVSLSVFGIFDVTSLFSKVSGNTDTYTLSKNDYDRYQLLGKAEDLLLSSGMVLPIYRTVTVNIINTEEVGGWASNAFDIHPLKYLYKRQVKSKLPNVVMK